VNIVLLQPGDWIDHHRVQLADRRFRHLVEVLGIAPGSQVKVGQINGLCGIGCIETLTNDSVVIKVELNTEPPARHPFTVVLALPRPKMLRRVLRTCAEFGVADIHLIHSWRVEKSFWQSPLLASGKIQEALQAGLERSGDTLLPKVTLHRRFRPFIEDELQELARGRPIYIAHPGQHPTLATTTSSGAVLLIGPEGGFIPFEVELAEHNGAQLRSMGSRILSVDTAVNAALARAWV